MDSRTLAMLRKHLPAFTPVVQSGEGEDTGWEHLNLPSAPGADYHFELYEYSNGEKHICARRCEASEKEYFWYSAHELYLGKDAEAVAREYLDDLEKLISHPTRIKQVRGILFMKFKCQYKDDEKGWKTVSSNSALKSGFQFPPMAERSKIYESPKLSVVG